MEVWLHQLITFILPSDSSSSLYISLSILLIAAMALISFWICNSIISVIVKIIVRRTTTEWDEDLLTHKVLRAMSQLAPALLVSYMLPDLFNETSTWRVWLTKATDFYILWAFIHLINCFLQALFDALDKRGRYRIHTMRGVMQMLKLFFIIIGIIIGISILFGRSPIAILTALGASAAVLMLVFQDTILGLVAGIQLTVNDMLKKGDWIIVPKANANGEVIEVSLTTVKVRNWDNSVTTIPPYTLVKESFNNYNPMKEAGARRVCRSILIDINSIQFVTTTEITKLKEDGFISPDMTADKEINLSLLTRHLEDYISHHPKVRTDLLYMVRQLQPTPQGVPLELYFFVNDTEWKSYEHLQDDFFNYVYCCTRKFGLTIYQEPTGNDFMKNINSTDTHDVKSSLTNN